MDADLPPPVRDLVARYLREVDGLVEQLYLTGSLALGDYQHGVSDVDFVAFTSRRPSDDDLRRLAEVHNGLLRYDGVYLGREALRTTPDSGEVVPHVVNGAFRTDQPCDELNPVLWLTLARYGIAVRGPAPADLGLRATATMEPGQSRRILAAARK